MKITVVVPTYRRNKELARCLNALAAQKLPKHDFEVFVVNDGFDESTRQIVAGFKKLNIKYSYTPEKRGPAGARNIGWLQAGTNLIAFTDDDCIPDKNWLKDIWRQYNGENEIAFTGEILVPLPLHPNDYEKNLSRLQTAEFVTANCVCTKQALVETGGFDERFKTAWREDSDLHFKLLKRGVPIVRIPALVVHPVKRAPWGISVKEQKKGLFDVLLYKNHPELFKQRIKSGPTWLYYAMVGLFTAAMFSSLSSRHWPAAFLLMAWLGLVSAFSARRLAGTSHSFKHGAEMFITSIVIPFISLYWKFYGSLKYRVILW